MISRCSARLNPDFVLTNSHSLSRSHPLAIDLRQVTTRPANSRRKRSCRCCPCPAGAVIAYKRCSISRRRKLTLNWRPVVRLHLPSRRQPQPSHSPVATLPVFCSSSSRPPSVSYDTMDPNRAWMYNRLDGRYLSKVFIAKVNEFITFACAQQEFQRFQKLKCPCTKCRNKPYLDVDTIKLHLYQRGFVANYYSWVHHGEPFLEDEGAGTSSPTIQVVENPMRDMVVDAYAPTRSLRGLEVMNNEEQGPIPEAKRFMRLLQATEKPLYEGCEMSLPERS